mmetsp:Transcript_32556/g.56333  ORF Transcript_32556/g.56333 Transcript_32556/m.56333 type:complete len:219 (-) Transcript_32556:2558-3214(-)
MWLIFDDSSPFVITKAAVSPPPAMLICPRAEPSARSRKIWSDPTAKAGNSQTPTGPFQTTVLEAFRTLEKISVVLGPTSIPIHPSGTCPSVICTSQPASNLLPHLKSTGRWMLTPFSSAFLMIPSTISAPSASKRLLPISTLWSFFKKVKAMPPPMIMSLHKSSKLKISLILSLTFAPPMMTVNGLAGLSKAFEKYSSSLPIKSPAALFSNLTPTIEL